jgi:hypothetical protein
MEIETTVEGHRHILVDIDHEHILVIRSRDFFITSQNPRVFIRFAGPLHRYTMKGGGKTITEENGISSLNNKKFVLDKQGGSNVFLQLDVNNFDALLSGAGQTQLWGRVREQSIFDVSGAGDINSLKLIFHTSHCGCAWRSHCTSGSN